MAGSISKWMFSRRWWRRASPRRYDDNNNNNDDDDDDNIFSIHEMHVAVVIIRSICLSLLCAIPSLIKLFGTRNLNAYTHIELKIKAYLILTDIASRKWMRYIYLYTI